MYIDFPQFDIKGLAEKHKQLFSVCVYVEVTDRRGKRQQSLVVLC